MIGNALPGSEKSGLWQATAPAWCDELVLPETGDCPPCVRAAFCQAKINNVTKKPTAERKKKGKDALRQVNLLYYPILPGDYAMNKLKICSPTSSWLRHAALRILKICTIYAESFVIGRPYETLLDEGQNSSTGIKNNNNEFILNVYIL